MTFQERLKLAFAEEAARRADAGEPRLTKTDIWKAADASSGAATHWFSGANGMDLATCVKVAPTLKVNARWLYDGTGPKKPGDVATTPQPLPAPWPFQSVPETEIRGLGPRDLSLLESIIRGALDGMRPHSAPHIENANRSPAASDPPVRRFKRRQVPPG